ncbi:KDO2-lipid IV(A) lauroyltransferase [Dyadobacter sp. BE34]|uniref:KDO2-lipid IV(A) lauroyltransferase n=1 Tax=Dyadobacter fermentans TaxID=94254 RepID=A0ABU1QSP0_9BACT|nr:MULTISPECIES: lysophospholipid acyltransferase family protein [Dyadobacter]MDR6804168.1 KDO2-lipid IV(A) lauroyltransferase [Dyadobacter fermentans]MDR7041908.1 KDO2-lipid IV(A) lauroyltransferase [Dyadobacter sp. BE242]MDR7196311.1 KDO2-lipid IV(A) lauroyltransferase [Dyadobacter sp. BE34]MDR7213144.1 KDO2-lipid IV(A) lauroyltransferase [Dyadobacter sp. BE31]MDR7261717.1 KDO2-lipid IV(A) lauroyltransferase [Dyadobacter sp. BE32]
MKSNTQQYLRSLRRTLAPRLTDLPATLLSKALLGLTSLLASLLSFFLRFVLQYRKTVIRKNLTSSFPSKSSREIRTLMSAYYRHMSDLLLEPFLFYLAPERLRKRLAKYINPEVLELLHANQRPVIVFASHYGNWEYLINLPQVTEYPVYTAYSPIKNSLLNGMMIRLRSFLGVKLIPKKGFYRQALSLLRQTATPNMLVVIADQRPAPGSDKFHISFLDQDTAVQTGGERMAASSQAAVVYVESQKRSRFSYEFTFRLMEHPDRSTPLSITKSYYHFLETSISRAPSYWLWSHNRWKIPSLGAIHSS